VAAGLRAERWEGFGDRGVVVGGGRARGWTPVDTACRTNGPALPPHLMTFGLLRGSDVGGFQTGG